MTDGVTKRRLEVFAAALAMGNRDAAEALGLTEQTVKNHVGDLFRALGVNSRCEAAIVLGWLKIPEPVRDKTHRRHADGGK